MALYVERVTPEDFGRFVASRELVIIQLHRARPYSYLDGVDRYVRAEYSDRARQGRLDRSRAPAKLWLEKHFPRSSDDEGFSVSDGYYLFQGGVLIAHHSGVAARSEAELTVDFVTTAVGLVIGSSRVGDKNRDAKDSEAVVRHFEEVLKERAEQAAMPKQAYRRTRRTDAVAPLAPKPQTLPEAYARVGIGEDASRADFKKAFHAQTERNHPDKVAHMSPAIRTAAEAEMRLLNEASGLIKKARGWR